MLNIFLKRKTYYFENGCRGNLKIYKIVLTVLLNPTPFTKEDLVGGMRVFFMETLSEEDVTQISKLDSPGSRWQMLDDNYPTARESRGSPSTPSSWDTWAVSPCGWNCRKKVLPRVPALSALSQVVWGPGSKPGQEGTPWRESV